MAGKKFRCGPVALTNGVANVLNPGTTTGGVGMGSSYGNLRITMRSIRATNKSGTPQSFSAWIGATGASAAGSEIVSSKAVPANDSVIIPLADTPLDVADFLTMQASANTAITVEIDGEIGVV